MDYILSNIGGFMEENICDEKNKKFIITMSYPQYERIISFLYSQKPATEIEQSFSLFKISIYNEKFEHVQEADIYTGIGTGIDDNFHSVIQATDQHITLHTLNVLSMVEYISYHYDNSDRRYLCYPLLFNAESKNASHQTTVVIDIINNKAYLVDPNGSLSYFNNMFSASIANQNKTKYNDKEKNYSSYSELEHNFNHLIDGLMDGYFKEFKKIGINIDYVPHSQWNPNNIQLNDTGDSSEIGHGFCVATSILFGHFLCLTKLDINDAINKFKCITSNERLYLINGYSCWLYQTFK
jgi:hypothetical protein